MVFAAEKLRNRGIHYHYGTDVKLSFKMPNTPPVGPMSEFESDQNNKEVD